MLGHASFQENIDVERSSKKKGGGGSDEAVEADDVEDVWTPSISTRSKKKKV